MALMNCNCSIDISRAASGKEVRTYNLYIDVDGEYKESEDIQGLSLDDLRTLARELEKSIQFETMLNNGNK